MRLTYLQVKKLYFSSKLINTVKLLCKQLLSISSKVRCTQNFKYANSWTKSPLFDMIFSKNQIAFYKSGMHLDSLVKTSAVTIFRKKLSLSLLVLDKFSTIFISKKTSESLWAPVYSLIAAYRGGHTTGFQFFWYLAAILGFFFLIA